jgi:hypothetical protein
LIVLILWFQAGRRSGSCEIMHVAGVTALLGEDVSRITCNSALRRDLTTSAADAASRSRTGRQPDRGGGIDPSRRASDSYRMRLVLRLCRVPVNAGMDTRKKRVL